MCGVAGSFDLRGEGRAIAWARERLRHRGPDGEGTWRAADDSMVLEHTRLAIIDPENREADQPFVDSTGRWALTYNGEIFNFRELRAELEAAGDVFATDSDTEVLLAGLIRHGEALLPRLRGMFAFVLVDCERGELLAARDQMGVKPLYYREHDGLLALCSEVRPLAALPDAAAELDPAGVVEYLAWGKSPSDRTVLAGVRKLLPGHRLRAADGRLDVAAYWDLLPPDHTEHVDSVPTSEVVERLEEAVRYALVSDVPVGLMLSGGIDSSLVAALAARVTDPATLTAYSVAFGGPDDEAQAAARLARDLGMRFHEVRVTRDDVRAVFGGWLDGLDYPTGNPTWIASWFIARAARADGIKVLLTGDGGDEVFGGYNRWMKYLRFHDRVWRRVPRAARRAGGRLAEGRMGGLAGDIAARAATDGELFVTSRSFHDDDLRACLGPAARAVTADHDGEVRRLRERFGRLHPRGDYLAWMSYAALKTSLVEDFLHRLDKMGMQHSVEGRVPLLDPVLAKWAIGLPQHVKVRGGEQKSLLRAAARELLPAYILERPKQGFCPPVADWSQGLLLGDDDLLRGPLLERGLLDPQALEHLRDRGEDGAFAAWTLGSLAEWSRRNLAGAGELASAR